MKKDIDFKPVEGVSLAIVKEQDDSWNVYIINENNFPLETLLITSKGYSTKNGKKTSTLRHMIEKLDPLMYEVVEPIDPQVFEMTNEYWVSYYIGKEILDKKFTFVEGSIREENMILIETLNKKGVLHI